MASSNARTRAGRANRTSAACMRNRGPNDGQAAIRHSATPGSLNRHGLRDSRLLISLRAAGEGQNGGSARRDSSRRPVSASPGIGRDAAGIGCALSSAA